MFSLKLSEIQTLTRSPSWWTVPWPCHHVLTVVFVCWLYHHVLIVPPCFDCCATMFWLWCVHVSACRDSPRSCRRGWAMKIPTSHNTTANNKHSLHSVSTFSSSLFTPSVLGTSLETWSLWNVCPWWPGFYGLYVPGDM